MRSFFVSLDLLSRQGALSDLTAAMGCPGGTASHDRNTPHPSGRSWERSLWRLDSTLPESAPLEDRIQALISRSRSLPLKDNPALPADLEKVLNIGVCFNGAETTVSLSPEILAWCAGLGIEVSMSAYPSRPE